MKKVIFLCLMVYTSLCGEAQVLTIIDQNTGLPLEFVSLVSPEPRASVFTNAKGQAEISAFRGSEKIEIRIIGFQVIMKTYAELEAATFSITLKPESFSMDEIVVSASRWSQESKDVPAKISHLGSKDIALQNPQTAADLLGASGEVFIQKSQQAGGSPMIRGFSTNRLLYAVDGVRMNTAIFRSGNLQNVISLDALAIEKAEVLFGPGSVMYGSDAIGGVMSFQTLQPQFSLSDKTLVLGKSLARYSSANNEKTVHFDINAGGRKFAFVSSLTSSDFGDLKMGSKGPTEYLRPFYVERIDGRDVIVRNPQPQVQKPSAYSQVNMMQKVRFSPSSAWDLVYGLHYSESSSYARYDRHIRYKNGQPRYGEWSYGPQKWMMNNLNITHNRKTVLYDQAAIRLAYQTFEESRIDRDINRFERHTKIENVEAYSLNFDFKRSLSEHTRLFYGFEQVINQVISRGFDEDVLNGTITRGASRYPRSTWESQAVYLNGQTRIGKKLSFQAGARYSVYALRAKFDTTFYPFPFHEAELKKGALTGGAGFVFRPGSTSVISMNLSSGFRAPNVDDMGKVFDIVAGQVVVPNPSLTAETAWNAEIGLAKVFGKYVKADLTAYYTLLQNAMVRRDFTLNGRDSIMYEGTMSRVEAIQNAAASKVYGVQAGLDIKAGALHFSNDFNYQIGEEELDDGSKSPSRSAPPWFGVSRLNFVKDKLTVQFYAVYSGEMKHEQMPFEEKGKPEIYALDRNGNPWSPGWFTFNFKAMVHVSDHFHVSAGVENISDQRYRPYSSGIVAPGRNIVLALKVSL